MTMGTVGAMRRAVATTRSAACGSFMSKTSARASASCACPSASVEVASP